MRVTEQEMDSIVDFTCDMARQGMEAYRIANILNAARSYARLQEVRCNVGGLTPRQEAAEERYMEEIRLACCFTKHVPFFSEDPRGYTVRIATSDSPMYQYATSVPTS